MNCAKDFHNSLFAFVAFGCHVMLFAFATFGCSSCGRPCLEFSKLEIKNTSMRQIKR
jgi:hypothetical protein